MYALKCVSVDSRGRKFGELNNPEDVVKIENIISEVTNEKGKKMKTLKIFIGYDPKEAVAFRVLCHSLLERSSKPISIVPINLRNLKNYIQENMIMAIK